MTAAILEQDSGVRDVPVAFLLFACGREPQAEGPEGCKPCVWDLKVSGRGSAHYADAPVRES